MAQNAVSPLVIAGIVLYALNFLLWIVILTKIDRTRLLGTLFITAGIALVALSS